MEERRKESQRIKDDQKKQVDRISEELKKERSLEREARRRALLAIKEDKEKRKRKVQAPPAPSKPAVVGPSQLTPKETSREELAFIQVKLNKQKKKRKKKHKALTKCLKHSLS